MTSKKFQKCPAFHELDFRLLFYCHGVPLPILAPLFQTRLAELPSDRSSNGPRDCIPNLPVHLNDSGVNED
jgi:hypothetical protein